MNARHPRSLFALLATGLFVVALVGGLALPAAAQPLSSARSTRAAYHDQWRKLWEDHITWTRVVILGILDGLPGTNAYVDRLLQNPADMGAALQPYYGATRANQFASLVHDHLTIAAGMLTAARNGDTATFNSLNAQWYQNAHDIAVLMHQMNPRYWPQAQTEQMWDDHLDVTLQEAVDNLQGHYAAEVTDYDMVHDMALQMADFISQGVIRQFPARFAQ